MHKTLHLCKQLEQTLVLVQSLVSMHFTKKVQIGQNRCTHPLIQNGVVCSPKCMIFAEYSLLAMFDTYPASKPECTTSDNIHCNMYVYAGLVYDSLRTVLGSLKEDKQFVGDDFGLPL